MRLFFLLLIILFLPDPLAARENLNELALIPASEFEMGRDKNIYGKLKTTVAAHKVYLDSYYLTRYEISNGEYQEFVQKTGYPEPPYWRKKGFNKARQPVAGINWFAARAYCEWRGWRLPTEAEWEKAATWDPRKKEKYIFPWGNNENELHKKMNFWFVDLKGKRGLSEVGSFKAGISQYGIYDLSGSVWEWVEDWFDKDYYRKSPYKNPSGPDKGVKKVLRGGSWGDYGPAVKPINRGADYPQNYYSTYGIRCAKKAVSSELRD